MAVRGIIVKNMADILGTAAGAVTGVGMGFLNNYFGQMREEQARRENYRYNEMAAQNADARTRALYNDFYSPEALKRQYMNAGLSPSLMFGGTPGQGGTTGAQGSGVSQGSTYMPISMLEGAQIANLAAQTEKTKAETKTIDETRGATIENIIAQTGNYKAAAQLQEAQTLQQEIRNTIDQATTAEQIQQITENLNQTIQLTEQALWSTENEKYLNKLNLATYEEQVRKFTLENQNLAKDLLVKQAQINLNDKQCKEIDKKIQLMNQQIVESKARIQQEAERLRISEKSIDKQVEWWGKQYELEDRKIKSDWQKFIRQMGIENKKIEADLEKSADSLTATILTTEKISVISSLRAAEERAERRMK